MLLRNLGRLLVLNHKGFLGWAIRTRIYLAISLINFENLLGWDLVLNLYPCWLWISCISTLIFNLRNTIMLLADPISTSRGISPLVRFNILKLLADQCRVDIRTELLCPWIWVFTWNNKRVWLCYVLFSSQNNRSSWQCRILFSASPSTTIKSISVIIRLCDCTRLLILNRSSVNTHSELQLLLVKCCLTSFSRLNSLGCGLGPWR